MKDRLTPLLPVALEDEKSERVRRNHHEAIAELQAEIRRLKARLEAAGIA